MPFEKMTPTQQDNFRLLLLLLGDKNWRGDEDETARETIGIDESVDISKEQYDLFARVLRGNKDQSTE